jgi:hypothetical protein
VYRLSAEFVYISAAQSTRPFSLVKQSLVVSASVILIRNRFENSVKNFLGDGVSYSQVTSSSGNCQKTVCFSGGCG